MKKLGVPSRPASGAARPAAHTPTASRRVAGPKSTSAPAPKPVAHNSGKPHENMTTVDENLRLTAILSRGEGRYTKGLFNKKGMVNFKLEINIQNREGLKISSVTAHIKGKGAQHDRKISTSLRSVTEFDLPTDTYGGNVEASVLVVYKIGIFKSKQIKTTVSKNF